MNLFSSLFMRSILAAIALCALVADAAATSGHLTIESGGVKRSAFIVEHSRLKRALRPTIIVLHGQSGTGLGVRHHLGLEQVMKSQSVVSVYPDALDGHWDLSANGEQRDLTFVRDLANKLVADGVADRKRIYVVGAASGGILAMRLACRDTTGQFAGTAALIALMPAADAANCKPEKPEPFLLMAGTGDPVAPFNGGKSGFPEYSGELASAEATLAPFVQAAGCSSKKKTIDLPDRDRDDGSRVQIESWQDCKAPVELVRIEGGGHVLPGSKRIVERGQALGARNNDIDAARLILDFFRRLGG